MNETWKDFLRADAEKKRKERKKRERRKYRANTKAFRTPQSFGPAMSSDFLKRAEHYCEQRGDVPWFKEVYTRYREHYDVTNATWRTLAELYSDTVADDIEGQSR